MKTSFNTRPIAKAVILTFFCGIISITQAQDLDSLYDVGNKEFRRKHFNRAEEIFDVILKKDPKHAPTLYTKAFIKYKEHKYDEAKENFKTLSSFKNEYQEEGYYYYGVILAEEEGKCEEAITNFTKSIELDTSNSDAYLSRAQCYIELTNYDEAMVDAEMVLEKTNNKSYKAYYIKGKAEMEQEKYDAAIASFTSSVELRPRYADPYFARGTVYLMKAYDQGEDHKHQSLNHALEDYNNFISLDKRTAAAYFDRGEVQMELGHYKEAIADFNRAIALDPDDFDAHTMKAICNYHYGYTEQALKEFDAIIRMDPTYVDAHYNKGVVLIALGRYEEAIQEFDQVVKKDPEHSDGFEKRGEAKFEAGMIDEACEDFNIAAEMGDQEAQYWVDHNCGKHKKKYKKKNKKKNGGDEEEMN